MGTPQMLKCPTCGRTDGLSIDCTATVSLKGVDTEGLVWPDFVLMLHETDSVTCGHCGWDHYYDGEAIEDAFTAEGVTP